MTDATIRPADSERDSAAIAELSTREFPFALQSAESMRHRLEAGNPRARRLALVAEADGRIVGFGSTMLDLENSVAGAASASVVVAPEYRRGGIGSALFERLAAHWDTIGATTVTSRLISDEAAVFAEKHGFERSRVERISHVPLAEIPAVVPPGEGIVLKFLSELDGYRALYDIDCAVVADIPADDPWETLEFEEWRQQYTEDPRLDRDSTVLAFDGDTPVAVAWLERVGARVWSGLTGTRPGYRGRGLAKAVKTAALHRARERGAADAYTNNDATNAGMLAVNTWLGYRLHTEQYTFVLKR